MIPIKFNTKINVDVGSKESHNDTVEFALPFAIEAWSLIIEFTSHSIEQKISLEIVLENEEGIEKPVTIPSPKFSNYFTVMFNEKNFFVLSLSISTNLRTIQAYEVQFKQLSSESDWYDMYGVSVEDKELLMKAIRSGK